ncbi:fibroblast growth factor 19 [Clarias magur]|uniref:Fibroblast growth factor n=1 Tax=Clarias magur TaxID=1594786 RepID=A0A8J4X7Z5_CLAMG|nr:fibroblast growth factor 19 [Clarias magur]
MLLVIFLSACWIGVTLADSGPHLANDWGESVRLRHLYAARPGLHLQISKDGKIGGSHMQSSHSLVEIRTVDTGCVVIKGVASSQFLCMEANGKLYGSHIYIKEDCSFFEHMMPDGYNIYVSGKHGTLVSLGGGKNRRQNALAQFLPLLNTLPQEPTEFHVDGYSKGFEEGTQQGLLEGRNHGMLHGAKFSAEVSFYHGFALTWKCLLQNNEDVKARKRLKAVEALDAMIRTFPYEDPEYENLQEHMERVRAKFRQTFVSMCLDRKECHSEPLQRQTLL